MAQRVMPHNVEAEKSVLGAMLLSKYAKEKALEELDGDLFYSDKHAKIFETINRLSDKKKAIDLTTITAELTDQNELTDVGGIEYLTEIIESVPTASNVDYYIEIVNEKAVLRKLIDTSSDIATMAFNNESSINETLDEAEKKILHVIKRRKASEFKKIQEVLFKAQADLEQLATSNSDITGLATGFYDLDKITAGFHGGEFIIIAARPAMGKTAFALNMATFMAANSDATVALFNMEMTAEQLATRMLSSLGQVEGYKLRNGKLNHNDWKKLNEAISQLADTKVYIDDTPGISIGEIRAKCRRLASSEEGLGIVIIDYLQLISGSARYAGNRQQEVSEISRSLKTLALELEVPVVALAQLSRAVEQREDKRPIMSDLRESGSIEQDADIVSFLYRDDYYNKEARTDDNTSRSEYIIGKHRNGPTATIHLLFKKETSTFLSFQKEE